jgi:hypothetical protein
VFCSTYGRRVLPLRTVQSIEGYGWATEEEKEVETGEKEELKKYCEERM